ncbi:Uncharacterised protein [Mycobacteroides abscessus subsp. abscessus]|nr:Uncharacterised protein [Mycobacteroides abscessus subsp. abscessus]
MSRPVTGNRNSASSAMSRRLAFSASAKAGNAAVSASLGRVRVSAQDAHSVPAEAPLTSQLHSATCRFAHN